MKSKYRLVRISIAFFLLVVLLPFNLHSQNLPTKTISINVFGIPFNDFSLFYEVTKNESKRYGISAGYMIAFNWWKGKVDGHTDSFEVDDDKFPIGSYSGPELRLYYENVKHKGDKNKFHGPEILFKYIYYNNKKFVDFFDPPEPVPVFFVRNEKTFVIGVEWLWGKNIEYRKAFQQIFWGIGCRFKIRNINTISNYSPYIPPENHRPIGEKHTTLFIPTVNFGVKFGTWIKNTKQTN